MVVAELHAEDYGGTDGGNHVSDDQRHVANNYALHHEEYAAGTHSQKRGEGNAVGVACAYGGDGLGQIAANHAD